MCFSVDFRSCSNHAVSKRIKDVVGDDSCLLPTFQEVSAGRDGVLAHVLWYVFWPPPMKLRILCLITHERAQLALHPFIWQPTSIATLAVVARNGQALNEGGQEYQPTSTGQEPPFDVRMNVEYWSPQHPRQERVSIEVERVRSGFPVDTGRTAAPLPKHAPQNVRMRTRADRLRIRIHVNTRYMGHGTDTDAMVPQNSTQDMAGNRLVHRANIVAAPAKESIKRL